MGRARSSGRPRLTRVRSFQSPAKPPRQSPETDEPEDEPEIEPLLDDPDAGGDVFSAAEPEDEEPWSIGLNETESIKLLAPHEAEPSVVFTKSAPRIKLSFDAFRDTQLIIESAGSLEVGWLGVVREDADAFVIERVFLFRQNVSASHCEFDEEDLGAFWAEALAKDQAASEWLNRILFWGAFASRGYGGAVQTG